MGLWVFLFIIFLFVGEIWLFLGSVFHISCTVVDKYIILSAAKHFWISQSLRVRFFGREKRRKKTMMQSREAFSPVLVC